MKTLVGRFALRLCALVAAASLIISATALRAVAQSDRMVVSTPAGVVYDTVLPDGLGPGPGTEGSLLWDPTGNIAPILPPGALTGAGLIGPGIPALGLSFVIMAEPVGEAANPGELPPPVYSTPNGPVFISDLLINGLNNALIQSGQLPPLIALLSDDNPDLLNIAQFLPAGVPVIFEDGTLQDLTLLMGNNLLFGFQPVSVQVQSDIVTPEPSTFVLAGLGILGLGFVARRRMYRRD